jgi:hypothetical protein
MSNMSHCRFQNTLGDLEDCLTALQGLADGTETKLSARETDAAQRLLDVALEMVLFAAQERNHVALEDLDGMDVFAGVVEDLNQEAAL